MRAPRPALLLALALLASVCISEASAQDGNAPADPEERAASSVESAPDEAPSRTDAPRTDRDASTSGVTLLDDKVRYRQNPFKVVDAPDEAPPAEEAVRYRVAVEVGLEEEAEAFTRVVDKVLGDPGGWASAGIPLVRVDHGEDITVLLARPETIDELCAPLKTGGSLSCATRRQANINLTRFRHGTWSWGEDVEGYHYYLINHEVGHLLGMRHEDCPSPGAPAPVMMQQTKGLARCEANGRPTTPELELAKEARGRREARWERLKAADARWDRR